MTTRCPMVHLVVVVDAEVATVTLEGVLMGGNIYVILDQVLTHTHTHSETVLMHSNLQRSEVSCYLLTGFWPVSVSMVTALSPDCWCDVTALFSMETQTENNLMVTKKWRRAVRW